METLSTPERAVPAMECLLCGCKSPQVETCCTECGAALPAWLAPEPGRELSILLRSCVGDADGQGLVVVDREQSPSGKTCYAVRITFGKPGSLGTPLLRERFPTLPLALEEAEKAAKEQGAYGYREEARSL